MAAVAKAKVLRSVFLDPQMDEILRQMAYRRNTSKGDLIRTYVERGLNADSDTLLPQAEAKAEASPKAEKKQVRSAGGTTVEPTASRGRRKKPEGSPRKVAATA